MVVVVVVRLIKGLLLEGDMGVDSVSIAGD